MRLIPILNIVDGNMQRSSIQIDGFSQVDIGAGGYQQGGLDSTSAGSWGETG
jgi:hypothetical protein